MGSVIGDFLPVALGVAISPVPIIAVILMLLSPRAGTASVAFMVGWVGGVTAVVTIVTLVVDPVDDSVAGDDPSTFASVAKLVLGAAAVLLAVREWRSRPRGDQEPELPGWMAAIDTITPARALGLGALLAGVNPKNLILCLTGGLTIASGALTAGETVIAVAVFVLIASCTVAVPVIGFLLARDRMQEPLDELRVWLTANNAAVMSVLLLVIGFVIIGKGVAGL